MDSTSEDDATLIRKSQAGDRDAFHQLGGKYRSVIYKSLAVPWASPAELEDIVQITLNRAWEKIAACDPERSFLGWLMRIAHNERARFFKLTGIKVLRIPPDPQGVNQLRGKAKTYLSRGGRLRVEVPTGSNTDLLDRPHEALNDFLTSLGNHTIIDISPRLEGALLVAHVSHKSPRIVSGLSMDEENIPNPDSDLEELYEDISAIVIELDLLRTAFDQGGTPWQVLAFGFNTLIKGWRRNPLRIVDELSHESLEHLNALFEQELIEETQLPEELVRNDLEPLRHKMRRLVSEILSPNDGTSKEFLALVLERQTGETFLCDYYGDVPPDSISQWSFKVKNKTRRIILMKKKTLLLLKHLGYATGDSHRGKKGK